MAEIVAGYVFTGLASAGVAVGTATAIATAVGSLTVTAAISLASAAIATSRSPGREDLKRTLATPTERPPYRFVYGETRATGSIVSWPVDGKILWGCWLLNSRPSDMSNMSLVIDDKVIPFAGDPFDFDDEDGGYATEGLAEDHLNFWVQRGHETSPPQRFLDDAGYDAVDHPEYYKSTDGWQGRTVIWMRLNAGDNDERAERWPQVPPLVEVDAKWSKLYDPREPSHDVDDSSTWEFSDNQAIVTLDLLMQNPVRPFNVKGLKLDTFEWGADVADVVFGLKSGGSEPQFRASGTIVFSEGVEIEDMIEPVLVAGGSRFTRVAGRLAFIPAVAKTPSMTITDALSGLQVEWIKPSRDLTNKIYGSYTSIARGYEDADLPPFTVSGDTLQGAKPRSMKFVMVQSPTQAMRLVKIAFYAARRQKKIKTVLPPQVLDLVAGSEADVAFPTDYAPINGQYEVLSIKPKTASQTSGVQMQCETELLIVDETGYEWNPLTDEVDVYDELFELGDDGVERPGDIYVTIGEVDTGSTVLPQIRFEFDPSVTSSVYEHKWEYRISGEEWRSGGSISDYRDGEGDAVGYLEVVSPTELYDIRVRAISENGTSTWREITGVGVDFDLSVSSAEGGIAHVVIEGTAPNSSTFEGIRLYSSTVGAPFGSSTLHGDTQTTPRAATFTLEFGDDDATNEIVAGEFNTSVGWNTGVGWTIGSGKATHAVTVAEDELSRSVSVDAADDYRFSYERDGGNSADTSFRISGATDNTSSGVTSDGWHQGVITAPASPVSAAVVADATFTGSVDNIYLVKDSVNALPLGVRDYWVVPVTHTGSEGSPIGPFTLRIY